MREELIHFINKYHAVYNTKPSPNGYAFLGFDIAYYHLRELLYHGTNFEQNIAMGTPWEGLQSIFNYHQIQASSGYENKGLYFIRYKGYELIRIGDSSFSRIKEVQYIENLENDSSPKIYIEED
jgi:hypothetical protein